MWLAFSSEGCFSTFGPPSHLWAIRALDFGRLFDCRFLPLKCDSSCIVLTWHPNRDAWGYVYMYVCIVGPSEGGSLEVREWQGAGATVLTLRKETVALNQVLTSGGETTIWNCILINSGSCAHCWKLRGSYRLPFPDFLFFSGLVFINTFRTDPCVSLVLPANYNRISNVVLGHRKALSFMHMPLTWIWIWIGFGCVWVSTCCILSSDAEWQPAGVFPAFVVDFTWLNEFESDEFQWFVLKLNYCESC